MPSRPCAHIMTSGKQCGSSSIRKDIYCYWHTEFRRQQRDLDDEARRPPEFIAPGFNSLTGEFTRMYPVRPQDISGTRGVIRKPLELKLGVLEDSNAIQVAIARVLTALAGGRLENRRATILLYGLQLAANNARAVTPPTPGTATDPDTLPEPESEILPDYQLPSGEKLIPEPTPNRT